MMNRSLFLCFLCFSLCLFGQNPSSSAVNTTQSTASAREKASKQQKNKKSDEADDLNATAFSDSVASAVMRRLADAVEGHNRKLMLPLFDADKMNDYAGFEGQIAAFFDHYVSVRVHLRILQTTTEGNKGIILTNIEMELLPGGEAVPFRRHDDVRLELERGDKSWRIVEIKPRDFFS
jgi:hypothetical protein